MAAGAVGMAVRSAQGTPASNAHLGPTAVDACTKQAARHGTVRIIDVAQSAVNRITVWGTVEDATQRRSFECAYGTKVTGFKLRQIAASR
jgi:hypothetical protein